MTFSKRTLRDDVNETLEGLFITSSSSVLEFVKTYEVDLCVNTAIEHVNGGLSAELNKYCKVIDWPLDDSPVQDISSGHVMSDLVDHILKKLKANKKFFSNSFRDSLDF